MVVLGFCSGRLRHAGRIVVTALLAAGTAHAQPTVTTEPSKRPATGPRPPSVDAPANNVATLEPQGDWLTTDFIATQKDGAKLFRRETRARRRSGRIRVDGVLDDAAWQAVPPTRFEWMERPNEGAKATGPTDFRVLYDDQALYVAVHARDPEPHRIAGVLHTPFGLSKIPQSDWIIAYVDPSLNRRLAYAFAINAAGVKTDLRQSPGAIDDTYQAVWEGETTRDATGWYAEFRIPYSQMRVRDGYQDRWGFQIQRKVSRTQERSYWSPFTFRAGMDVTGYGNLVLDGAIDAGRPIEVMPYVLGGARLQRSITAEDKLNDSLAPQYSFGADVKMQVARSLRFTASINPDFGQIEADPSEVNLTDQETYFSERRPLFIEDADLYQLPVGRGFENFFYSRRIGAPPTFSQAGSAVYVDEPDVTTIYGAGKLSGEIGAGVNIGLLSALAAEERSRGQLDNGEISEAVIEPMTSYNVAQLNRSFRGGSSDVRAAITGVQRFGDDEAANALHRHAYTGALQYLHQFADNRYAFFGMVGGSRVEGDPATIAATQTASQRYFQRPDATHVALDPTRTSLEGYAFNTQLRKIAGTLHGEVGIEGRSPGLELNDIGFQTDADLISPWASVSLTDTAVGGKTIAEADVAATVETFTNFAPDVLRHRGTLMGSLGFANQWKSTAMLQVTRSVLDTRLLRGGPAVGGEDALAASGRIGSDVRKDFQVSLSAGVTSRPVSDSLRTQASLGLLWNVRSNVELSFAPTVIRNVDDSRFIGAPMDAAGNHRYVLGRLEQTTLVGTTRLDYIITPRLSLQLYAEPFVSAGRHRRFKETADVRAGRYDDRFREFSSAQVSESTNGVDFDADGDGSRDFSVRRPDFKVSALVSNVVFRWEYLPGSNLYVIWSQARNGFAPDGTLGAGDVGDVFTNPSAHVFVVKLSYWWNR